MEPINLRLLLDTTKYLADRHIPYKWGGKASPLTINPAEITGLDCSGFVQYTYYLSSGGLVIPEGSVLQHAHFERLLEAVPYETVGKTLSQALYICYIEPKGNEAGHTWYVQDRVTSESYGGHGVGHRPWDHSSLVNQVDACYILPHTWE
jgi:cell wall-associated NlpC family hydrolase